MVGVLMKKAVFTFSLPFISQVLELLSCECKKKCDETCLCASNDFKCTDMCSCNNCDKKTPIDETYDDESNDSLGEYSDESDSEC